MEFFATTGFVNAIFALGFGLIVVLKNWRVRFNQLFFLMTLAVAVWALCYWRWLSSTGQAEALYWVWMLSAASFFIPVLYFHWVTAMLELRGAFTKWVLFGAYFFSVFGLFLPSHLIIQGVRPILEFPYWPEPGAFYTLYLLFIYLGVVSYGIALMLRRYRSASPILRQQIFYVMLGTVFGFGGGLTNFFLWYGIPIQPFGNVLVALFPFFLGYATLKHHLFDLKVIATELLVTALWMFLLVRIVLANNVEERLIDGGLLAILVVFGIFLIQSVRQEVKNREAIESLAVQLSDANEELKKLDAAKSEFISIAGHQLRTPLTVIKGYASMMMEGSFGEIGEKAKDAINKVFISSVTLTKLVADLLDLSRIEAGKIRYDMKEMKLDDVIYGVIGELSETASAKSVTLKFSNQNLKNKTIFADVDKMHELVINLTDNAIKYSEKGRVDVGLAEAERDRKRYLLLSIKDTGMGIKPEDLPKLFTKFVRSEEARKVRPDGMGIGLYFAKKITEDHHGRIWAESPGLGKGSTFFVELPIH